MPYGLMSESRNMLVFDRDLVKLHRERAAPSFGEYSFLFETVAGRLVERLKDINRHFTKVLDLGARQGHLGRLLGAEDITSTDLSAAIVAKAPGRHQVADEEQLPFPDPVFDLVCSNLSLHWVNDLPGSLIQIRNALKPDGLFLAALFGGETLHELRQSLLQAEAKLKGSASPRISPFGDVRALGNLLQRAGFAMPVADMDMIHVNYDNIYALMRDLRGMGESNALLDRHRKPVSRALFESANQYYCQHFSGENGKIVASFEIIYLTGWAPGPDQPVPKRPGSATHSLKDALAR